MLWVAMATPIEADTCVSSARRMKKWIRNESGSKKDPKINPPKKALVWLFNAANSEIRIHFNSFAAEYIIIVLINISFWLAKRIEVLSGFEVDQKILLVLGDARMESTENEAFCFLLKVFFFFFFF